MPTPIADLADAKSVADLRAFLKYQALRVSLYSGMYQITCVHSGGLSDSYFQFSRGATVGSPEQIAFNALLTTFRDTYFLARVAELDVALTGWNIIY